MHRAALAVATAAVVGLWSTQAQALSLGRLTVLSALGEPLRAEIDIPDITAEEAASLKAGVAPPEAFQAAGIEYHGALTGLQITLQRRADGRAFLRLSSERFINEPFLDLILEANWSSGRIVRDYTLLLDPPSLRREQALNPTAPQVSLPPVRQAAQSLSAPAASAVPTRPATGGAASRASVSADRQKPVQPSDSARQVTIRAGDTASQIAAAHRPAGISLDQMLMAMLRTNPEAFVNGNINRIRAGAVMNLPDSEQASTLSPVEARQQVVAHSKDFGEFRARLAASAPAPALAEAGRQARGTVQAQVQDTKPSATTPDRLTLSKGGVQAKSSEEKIARERSVKEDSARVEELSKNIADLTKLAAAAPAAAAPAASASLPAAGLPVAAGVAPVASAPSPTAPSPAASAPMATASASSPAPGAPPKVAAPAPMPEPGLLDELLDNPLVPAAAASLIGLLAALGFIRMRRRKTVAAAQDSVLEARLPPDFSFESAGNQGGDTQDKAETGSPLDFSPAPAGDEVDPMAEADVDPVAEAEVYLAYGRDQQAEEILKEALQTHPERIAVHQKLLDIYAKWQDAKSFEEISLQLFKLTGGQGVDWDRARQAGLRLDPDNTLYQPAGEPAPAAPAPLQPKSALSGDDVATANWPKRSPAESAPVPESSAIAEPLPDTSPDFSDTYQAPMATLRAGAEEATTEEAPLTLEADSAEELSLDTPVPTSRLASPATPLEFDLGGLSLDLGPPDKAPPADAPKASTEDTWATKLALAEEFSAMGDKDGARVLIEEIVSQASGEMKARAQAALSQLG